MKGNNPMGIIEKLLAALEGIAAGLRDLNVNLVATNGLSNKSSKATTAAPAASPDKPAPESKSTDDGKADFAALADKFRKCFESGEDGAAKCKAILKKLKLKKLSEAKPEQYADINAALDAGDDGGNADDLV